MSDSEDDSILDNIHKTRELWNTKSDPQDINFLIPKSSISPATKQVKSPPPVENHVNNNHENEEIIRFEDQVREDFDLPDVKSMKSQWEKPGPPPQPKAHQPTPRRLTNHFNHQNSDIPVPVNREPDEQKEEYKVELGSLREKFEKEAKAQKVRSWEEKPQLSISKSAVDQRVNIFETEIEHQRHYHPARDVPIELPKVELTSIKEQFEKRKDESVVMPYTPNRRRRRDTSISSDTSARSSIDVVRYDDPPEQDVKFDIEYSSIRKKFEQASSQPSMLKSRSTTTIYVKPAPLKTLERRRSSSQSEDAPQAEIEIVRSSEPKYDTMTGEESVKDKLARFKAMSQEQSKSSRKSLQKKPLSETNVVVKKHVEEQTVPKGSEIVRSSPAGTKEKPEYTPSIDLEQTKQLFEQTSRPSRSSRSSRSSGSSPQRRSPRSHSTPSPIKRGSRSSTSSQSGSPVGRSSTSDNSSDHGSPHPVSKFTTKKAGDPDIVVLEHNEVNYYYEDGKRHSTKVKSLSDIGDNNEEMSNGDVIRPNPAGTKEAPDYVPSINIRSVRDMFEHPQEKQEKRGRAPPQKTIVITREEERDSPDNTSPERNPDVVRSTAAGVREEPKYEISLDLKAARSKFESPQRTENYVPRNTIRQREEEARQRRAAAAAAAVSPRSSESSDANSDVVKTTEAGSKEKPEYQVDLKATKQLFEGGGSIPVPKRESTTQRVNHPTEIQGDVVRPDPAGTREVVFVNTSSNIGSIKKTFEETEAQEEEEKQRKSPIDIQEEARMAMKKEQELKEESVKVPDDSQNVEQDSSEDGKENGTLQEQEKEEDQETAAGVIPVRVAITEDLEEKEKTEEEPEPSQEYETYTKVIDYEKDTEPQAPSSSDSDSDAGRNAEFGQEAQDENLEVHAKSPEDSEQGEINYVRDEEVNNHLPDSPPAEEQNSIIEQGKSPESPPSPPQEKEGDSVPDNDDDGNYLQ